MFFQTFTLKTLFKWVCTDSQSRGRWGNFLSSQYSCCHIPHSLYIFSTKYICIYVYMYIYLYIHIIFIPIYKYIYIKRERDNTYIFICAICGCAGKPQKKKIASEGSHVHSYWMILHIYIYIYIYLRCALWPPLLLWDIFSRISSCCLFGHTHITL